MLAFGNSYHENNLGKKWLWEISKIARKNSHNCSLFVTETHKSFQMFFSKIKHLLIPIWISGDIDISHENPSLPKNKGLKADISKIKKNKLAFEVTDKLSDLHSFYYQMHLPFITKVHGNRSVINTYNAMKEEFGKHGPFNNLLLIRKENEYIAGILIGDKNNIAKLGSLGIKDGNLNYIKDRAIGALIYFSIVHFAKKGLTKFEFGKSRPFLKDGILQYKKKWNQQISNHKNLCFLINMLSETEGARRFLENNPFVYENNSGLNAAIFTEGNLDFCKEDFEKLYKDYYLPGLSKLVIYQFGHRSSETSNIIPEELSGKITISPAKNLF